MKRFFAMLMLLMVTMVVNASVGVGHSDTDAGVYVNVEQSDAVTLEQFSNLFLEQISTETTFYIKSITVPEVFKVSSFINTSINNKDHIMKIESNIVSLIILINNGYLTYSLKVLDSSKFHYKDRTDIKCFIENTAKKVPLI